MTETTKAKIGFHAGSTGSHLPFSWFEALDKAGIPFFYKRSDAAPDVKVLELARSSSVNHTIVYRRSVRTTTAPPSGNPDVPRYIDDYDKSALEHWAWHKANLPPEVVEYKDVVWIEIINEPDQLKADWLGYFSVSAGKLMLADGFKYSAFGWAGGNPGWGELGIDDPAAPWRTSGLLAYLRLCEKYPDDLAVSIHEYSFSSNIFNNYPFLVGRFQYILQVCEEYNIKKPRIQITEGGYGKDHNSLPNQTQRLNDYDLLSTLYSNCIDGFAIWCLNKGGDWGKLWEILPNDFDPLLKMTLEKEYPITCTEGENMDCKWNLPTIRRKSHLIPQNTTWEEMKIAANVGFNNKESFCFSHDDGAIIPAHGDPNRSTIVLWNKERWDFNIKEWMEERGILTEEDSFSNYTDGPSNYIDVPIYNQLDNRWKNDILGLGLKTIGNWGCLLVVYNMLAEYYNISNNRNPNLENEYYKSNGCFSGSNLISMAMSKAYGEVENEGWLTTSSKMHVKTKEYLDQGLPVPAQVDFNPATPDIWEQHWVLIVGYDDNGYIINDPWQGRKAVYLKDFYGDLLIQCLYYKLETPTAPSFNVRSFVQGIHRVQFDKEYVINGRSGTQTTQIFHLTPDDFLYIKGEEGQYEKLGIRLYNGLPWIFRFEDTSESLDRFYIQFRSEAGPIGSPWIPLNMEVGKIYNVPKFIQHYNQVDCSKLNGGAVIDRVRLVSSPYRKTYPSGKEVELITIQWLDLNNNVIEEYDFGGEYGGNIGFRNNNSNFYLMNYLEGRSDKEYIKPSCIDLGW